MFFRRPIILLLLCLYLFGIPVSAKRVRLARPVKDIEQVQAGFNNQCEPLLLDAIGNSRKSIDIAIFTFTRKAVAEALIARAQRRVRVRMKIDAEQAKYTYTKRLLTMLKEAGIEVIRIEMKEGWHMHHKFAVIDGKTVLTGSFNWTRQASISNWENLVIIDSEELAAAFAKHWDLIGGERE